MQDLIIIGGGPAGLTAALYASRASLSVTIVEKGLPGGQMQNTLEVENYPGFKEVIGPVLSDHMYQQALHFGASFKQGEVLRIEETGSTITVYLENEVLPCRALLIATGARPRYLHVPGEKEFAGKGVSYCATCDGAFFRGKEVVVVGGGDSAIEESLFLTRFASKVTVVHRREALRATPILQERAFSNPAIEFIWNATLEEIFGDTRVKGVRIKNTRTQETSEVSAQGVFIYVGVDPATGFLKDTGLLDEEGYITTDKEMATRMRGVYAAGDVRDTNLRQIITACSDGAVAAMSIYHYLQELGK